MTVLTVTDAVRVCVRQHLDLRESCIAEKLFLGIDREWNIDMKLTWRGFARYMSQKSLIASSVLFRKRLIYNKIALNIYAAVFQCSVNIIINIDFFILPKMMHSHAGHHHIKTIFRVIPREIGSLYSSD